MFRRGFLTAAVGAIGAAIGGGLATLGGMFAKSTSRWPVRSASQWAAVCKLSDLASGEPFEGEFSFDRVEGWYRERVKRLIYVTKDARGAPVVFSRRCTHLGCPVKWKPEPKQFQCACHGGKFDPSGNVVHGPPDRPLTVLECRIAGEMIEVKQV